VLNSKLTSSTSGSQLGAFPVSDNQTRFSVWAPNAKTLAVQLIERTESQETALSSHELTAETDGRFQGIVDDCPADSLYRLLVNGNARPDPRSRFQPFGVHGPSQVIDPNAFKWTDSDWNGINKRDLVIYEMHLGSFTEKGDYGSAIKKLKQLRDFGFTAIEVLPLAQCPGKWNWGYDGVNYFAPSNNYGTPDELKQFVDACHQHGLAVLLDVVYNHVGPEGNYLSEFAPYRAKQGTPWGDAFNFDERSVRDFVIDNAIFWLDEYHFDGLRLDAVHYMFDHSDEHILDEIQTCFREFEKTINRKIYLIGESNIYDPDLVRGSENGTPHYDGIWSDCLMHSIYKAGEPDLRLTNRHYQPTDIAETLEHAYVFSTPQAIRVDEEIRKKNHPGGDRSYIASLIMALQTHDSVGNHPHGKRIHHLMSVEFQMAAAPLVLLYPSIPMIFMGEEWATDAPFPFFADFEDQGLRKAVDKGRRDEYPHHDWADSPLPSDPAAFLNSKSNRDQENQTVNDWYRELLRFRKQGIDDGWLCVENFATKSDLDKGIFRLIYRWQSDSRDNEVQIVCRLARDNTQAVSWAEIECHDPVYNSRPNETSQLVAEHCLIWLKQ
jgi:malto-oligosyltrehalose trehalohydrolase